MFNFNISVHEFFEQDSRKKNFVQLLYEITDYLLQVATAVQQPGYAREKRGYKQIRGIPVPEVTSHNNNERTNQLPNDPLYPKQWYIVSIKVTIMKYMHLAYYNVPTCLHSYLSK